MLRFVGFLPIPILVGEVFKDHHRLRSNNMKNPKRRVIRRSFPNIHYSVMFLSLLIRFKVPPVHPQVHILLFGIKFWIHRLLCNVSSMIWSFKTNNLLVGNAKWSTNWINFLLTPATRTSHHLLPLWMIEGVLLSFPLFAFILCHWGQCLILSVGEGIDYYYYILIIRKGYILLLGYIISKF